MLEALFEIVLSLIFAIVQIVFGFFWEVTQWIFVAVIELIDMGLKWLTRQPNRESSERELGPSFAAPTERPPTNE